MKSRSSVFFLLFFFGTGVCAERRQIYGDDGGLDTFTKTVGIYHWGGVAARGMSEGVERIASLSARNARVTMSPRYYTDYNVGVGCYPSYTLTALAQEPDVYQALGNPKIDTLMITAYDGATFGDCTTHRYLNPSFYTAENTAAVEREYSDFTLALFQAYKGTGKRFILSQWESDNAVYCGAAYTYATNAAFRSGEGLCGPTNYPKLYSGNTTPQESLDGLRLWLQARARGIADGKTRAAALNLGGVEVLHAPEFNIVHALRENGFPSVLYDVLPQVPFDFISYSSYESINQADPATSLKADLDSIQGVIGSHNVIIGEAGFSRSIWGEQTAVSRTEAVINSAISWGVPYLFQWNLYDQNMVYNLGLYDQGGKVTVIGRYYEAWFGQVE